MSDKNSLELSGNLNRNPLVELLAEISQIKLCGSLRISNQERKTIVYVDKGDVVFAVSNVRKHRFFEILLDQNQITREKLSKIDNFTNDFYLAKSLVKNSVYSKESIDAFFVYQIEKILEDAINWNGGEWKFSSLARIKEGIRFDVNLCNILVAYAKKIDTQGVLGRFKSFDEKFCINKEKSTDDTNFSPHEAFIHSRIGESTLTIDQLKTMCGLPDNEVMQILYRLWLGRFVNRENWNSAFSTEEVSKINLAKYTLKTSATSVEEEQQKAKEEKEAEELRQVEKEKNAVEESKKLKEKELTLEEYIDRIKNSATHYETLDLKPDAKLPDIKRSYFALAKKFHPDLYHATVEPEMLKTIQNAFTEMAQAYETLKDEEAREVYDFKLRKVLQEIKANDRDNSNSKEESEADPQVSIAAENFDSGYDFLMEQNFYEALPYLGRAVHMDDGNARYHAFYGKALSFDNSQYHKAESELQTAIKIEPKNTTYRIMLAELFIKIGHKARAKGEIKRLLKVDSKNQEAKSLLDSLS